MKLIEACDSLKLECALRELGFVEIGWKTVAHAGIYFVEPIGMRNDCQPEDEALGFAMGVHMFGHDPGGVHFLFQSANEKLNCVDIPYPFVPGRSVDSNPADIPDK